jgi:hypothetical protein
MKIKRQSQVHSPYTAGSLDLQRNIALFLLGLQMNYDLDIAEDALSSKINGEIQQMTVF